LFAREIAGKVQGEGLRGIDFAELADGRLAEALHKFINAAAGVFVCDLDIRMTG
jgi:hypothetical protein